MNVKNRVAALFLGGLMVCSLAACSGDTTWAAKSGENVMPAGVYILSQIDAFYKAKEAYDASKPEETEETSGEEQKEEKEDAFLKKTIDGKDGTQYVVDLTADLVRRYFAADKLFEEQGLSFDENTENALLYNHNMVWQYNGPVYLQNGISEESVTALSRNYSKQDQLFAAMYAEGGERPMSDKDYADYYNDTRVRIRYLPFSLLGSDYMPVDGETAKQREESANAYFERAKAGEDLDKLIVEYQNELGSQEASNAFKAGQYDIIVKKDSKNPSATMIQELSTAPTGEVRLIKDGAGYYVCMRVDGMYDLEQYEALKPTMLQEMKQEEFDQWLDEQGKAMDVTFNDTALKRYTPGKLNLVPPTAAS